MIRELDLVVLTRDLENHGLEAGDVGTVVHCYADKAGFEVEFVAAEGKTIGVLTLTTADIRPFQNAEILHSRDVTSIAPKYPLGRLDNKYFKLVEFDGFKSGNDFQK